MKRLILISFLVSYSFVSAQTFIGQWRDHLPYSKCTDITQNEKLVFAATENSVFSVDKEDLSISRINKIHGLTDIGISTVSYNPGLDILVVGFTNGGINLVMPDEIVNMPEIVNAGIIGDKQVYDIYFQDNNAWLSTGFGIVIIDLINKEVRDTYFIGANGSQVKVKSVAIYGETVYAASEQGIYTAPRTGVNLSDFNNWSIDNTIPSSSNGYQDLLVFQNELWAMAKESDSSEETIYRYDGDDWTPFISGSEIRSMNADDDYLSIVIDNNVKTFDGELNLDREIFGLVSENTFNPNAAVVDDDGRMWIADGNNGVVTALNSWNNQEILPNGPLTEAVWSIDSKHGDVWVAPGAVLGNWDNSYNNDSFFKYQDGFWYNYKDSQELQNTRDNIAVAINPSNRDQVYFGSWNEGLVEINGNNISIHNALTDAEPIEESIVNPGNYRIGGLDFDDSNNIWMTNSHTENGIVVRLSSGAFVGLDYQPTLPSQDISTPYGEIEHSSFGQLWVVLPRANGIFVADYNGTPGNQSDDQFKRLNTSSGNGGLHTNDVYDIVEDLDGEIWVGTAEGITVFYNPTNIFSSNPSDAQRILITQDGNLQYLLETEVVTTIAIDGANKKWIGTQNGGVFLMSEDGTEQIYHFTAENSPLFSNSIRDIAIDDLSGEVFIGTSRGLISFTAEATNPFNGNECLKVFPNPVKNDFNGVVAIEGTIRDATVKITDVAGNLVNDLLSEGGRAVWDRKNFNGEPVKTGVYLAFVVDESGETSCVSKILVIN